MSLAVMNETERHQTEPVRGACEEPLRRTLFGEYLNMIGAGTATIGLLVWFFGGFAERSGWILATASLLLLARTMGWYRSTMMAMSMSILAVAIGLFAIGTSSGSLSYGPFTPATLLLLAVLVGLVDLRMLVENWMSRR